MNPTRIVSAVMLLGTAVYAGPSEFPSPTVPGVVVDHIAANTGVYVGSPSIAVLTNGDYVASHDHFGPKSTEQKQAMTAVFRSADRGRTWKKISEVNGAFWSSLFVHRGALFLLGADRHHGNVVIRRSADGGRTWSTPSDDKAGLLRADGEYHCAPVPVIEHGGRLWRAFEWRHPPVAWGINYRAGILSAPADADLLDASNWTASEFIPSSRLWNAGDMGAWLEGNAVVTPSGDLVDILRVQTLSPAEKAAIVRVEDGGKKMSFDPDSGFIDFPGGSKKFTIRFDPQTKLYWSLSNIIPDHHRAPNPGGIRNTLALTASNDLTNWTVRCILLYHPDARKHGFQYVDWLFDGADIIAACRTAYDDGQGGAHNAHDANFLTFHRFQNFRAMTMADSVPFTKLPPSTAQSADLKITGTGWTIANLADNEPAFGNRGYVWKNVPGPFRGWRITRTNGGEEAKIRARAKRDTALFVVISPKQSDIDLYGWTPATAAFYYSDKNKTPMMIYHRPLKAGQEISVPQHTWTGMAVLLPPDNVDPSRLAAAARPLERLKYNNPGLVVDLGVGLWAWPLPMDFDGDGDLDLVVNCPDKPYNGTYFFENASGDTAKNKMPIFKAARRISRGLQNVQVSYVEGKPRVLSPAIEYPEFLKRGLENGKKLPLPTNVHTNKVRANMWRYADYDGDGALDLIVGAGDWTEYGWDNAYDAAGNWTNGPLRGFVYAIKNSGTDASPTYAAPEKIMAGDRPVEVFGWPSPNLSDFDNDGDLDMLCGEFLDGFTYFENVGTRAKPKYQPGKRVLTADGKPLVMDLQMVTPTAIDWDGDRDLDLIVGDEDGRVALVENTGRLGDDRVPRFLPPTYFQQEADDLKFGALATPCAFDWDSDGDTDIICGNTAGYIAFFENLGRAGEAKPRWAAPKYLKAGGRTIRIMAGPNGSIQGPCEAKWGYTTQTVADWDGDGLPDILANSILGKVHWYRNVGTRHAPELEAAKPIEVEWQGPQPNLAYGWLRPEGNGLLTQWRTTPIATDWDRDGLTDLVMLDHEGYLAFFKRAKSGDRLILRPPVRAFYDEKGLPLRLNSAIAGKSGRRKLCVVDWDGDGRTDILANAANAKFLRQIDERDGKWFFKDMGLLAQQSIEGHDVSPTVADFDANGVPDFIGGAEDGRFYYLPNPRKDPAILQSEFIYETAPFPSCHATTIAETGDSLVAAWFGGTREGDPDVGIWVARHADGQWTAPVEVANGIQPDGTRHPCWNPVLFQPKQGPLLLFYKVGPSPQTWWGVLRTSENNGKSWGPARRLPDGFLGPIKNKPIQLPDGSLLCPSSSETEEKPSNWRVHFERTPDLGNTWERVEPPSGEPINAIQPSILSLANGAFKAIGRTREKHIFETISNDRGKSWSALSLSSLPNPNSGTDAVTLADGRHLLVYNHTARGRSPLNLAVSANGKDWRAALVLEDEPKAEFSYPAIVQTTDGLVHITYTWKRQKVRHVVVDPSKIVPKPMPADTPAPGGGAARSPITNGAQWDADRPVALPNARRPLVENVLIYRPETEWTYSHHQSLTFFKGSFYAIWSNGRQDEDAPGQRVLMATSSNFTHWTNPRPLVDSVRDEAGIERVLTAAGFHQHDGILVAYFGNYGPRKETTHLQAVTTTDGQRWSAVREMGIPVNPNHGPQPTRSGRLIISGNISFPYTDDPTGLAGWRMTGIYPKSHASTIKDDPASFWEVAKAQGWSMGLCEGSFFQTDDGSLHMLLRNAAKENSHRLWLSESRDDGASWSRPAETNFSDTNAKFHFGRLPDGRFFYVGNPIGRGRTPLVLSLSRDGIRFGDHFILGETRYEKRRAGAAKGGEYGYPHCLLHNGYLYVIVSRQKEAVEVLRVALSELT